MKKQILAIMVAGILAVSGASAAMAGNASAPADAGKEENEVRIETDSDPEDGEFFEVSVEDGIHIITPYYSVTVPECWKDAYFIGTVSNFTGMWLKLFHVGGENGIPGHLFSIYLTANEDYDMIPDNDLVGELEGEDGRKYHVVAVYPTDVQYSREDRNNYTALFNDAPIILDTFQPADGWTYEEAAQDRG